MRGILWDYKGIRLLVVQAMQKNPTGGPVVEILVADDAFDPLVVVIRGRVFPCQGQRSVEDVQAFRV